MELGGKDPAYVRPDCDLKYTVETLVDGSFFNSGQCCCAIERIYVHADIYDAFVDAFVAETKVLPLILVTCSFFFCHKCACMKYGRRLTLPTSMMDNLDRTTVLETPWSPKRLLDLW